MLPLAILVLVGLPSRGLAWDHLRAANTGIPAHWESLVVPWQLAGAPADLPADVAAAAVRASFAAWEEVGCHLLDLVEVAPAATLALTVDGANKVAWIPSGWFGSPAEIAITSVTIHDETGRIVDADMALNDEGYTFALDPLDGVAVDLRGIVTHEAGHVLGLAHSAATGATMTEYVVPTDTAGLGSIEVDDRVGLCGLYEPSDAVAQQESTAPSPDPRAPVVTLALALALLVGRRQNAALLLALALLVASPRCSEGPGSAPLADTADATSDIAAPDAGPDAADASLDASEPIDLEALFADGQSWVVVRWETVEAPGFPAAFSLDLPESGEGGLQLMFEGDGSLRRVGVDGSVDFGCRASGRWQADGSELTLRWRTTPIFCPSARPEHVERFTAQAMAGGRIALTLEESPSTLGVTGSGVAPFRMELAPLDATAPLPACPGLPEPAECTLTCALEGEGLGRVPVYALGCGTGASSCTVIVDEVRGRVVERTCTDGCHTVTCTVNADEIGGCELQPGGETCSY